MFPFRYFLYALLLLLFSCKPEKKRSTSYSFYYWKSEFSMLPADTEKLKQLKTDHLYIHCFDVDWSEALQMPIPKAILNTYYYDDSTLNKLTFTPVVFITNRTFDRMPEDSCMALANKIARKIKQVTANASFLTNKIHEIQIDCDWTATTRQKYFRFLQAFKKEIPGITLSATIRLYPYKYPDKMGIPPVDKGMLMCYNLGKITAPGTHNSIFDIQELKQYLDGKKYPLPLDLAFPVFGWYAWFRDNKFKRIVYNDESFIADTTVFAEEPSQRYRVSRDTVIDDQYFREGDLLRMEFPDQRELSAAVDLMTDKVPGYQRIAFYYWNLPSITTYESVIQETFDRY
jgi:hypothetical protein